MAALVQDPTIDPNTLVPRMKGKELEEYSAFTPEDKHGYLQYRADRIRNGVSDQSSSVWVSAENWRTRLDDATKQQWIRQAAIDSFRPIVRGYRAGSPLSDGEEDEVVQDLNNNEATQAGERWRWAKKLHTSVELDFGTGSFMHVSRYVKVDQNNVIRDRIVMKRVSLNKVINQTTLAAEQQKINALGNCDNITNAKYVTQSARGYTNYPADDDDSDGHAMPDPLPLYDQMQAPFTYRLYYDYAKYGDLYKLFQQYDQNSQHQIPEPFIWLVFLGLTEAIFAMNTGECAKDRLGQYPPLPILNLPVHAQGVLYHQDIKPENVFLDEATAPYLGYPNPKLGDFGESVRLDHNFQLTDHVVGPRTRAGPHKVAKIKSGPRLRNDATFRAPEVPIAHFQKHRINLQHPISTKTDIWSARMVIWTMVFSSKGQAALQIDRTNAIATYDDFARDERGNLILVDGHRIEAPDTFRANYRDASYAPRARYTQKLVDTVWHCLKKNPADRPDYDTLKETIQQEIGQAEWNFGDFREQDLDQRLHLQLGPELFPIGHRIP